MKNRVIMELIGQDGNAFSILGRFQGAARKAGWTPEEIKEVMDEAQSGDYNKLLYVIMQYVDEPEDDDDNKDDLKCFNCREKWSKWDICDDCENCPDCCECDLDEDDED